MRPKIVIADDDPGVQDIFRIIFEKAGFKATIFPNGDSLLKNKFELPDVFLLDKQLSGYDGLEICRHLKSGHLTKDIPVIIVSATPGLRDMSVKAGADDFVEKPFTTSALLEKVRNAIASRAKKKSSRLQA